MFTYEKKKKKNAVVFKTRIESKLKKSRFSDNRAAIRSLQEAELSRLFASVVLWPYRCPSLCSSHSFQRGVWAKAVSQAHSGGQHFTNMESVYVEGCGGMGGVDPCCLPSGQMAGLYASMVATEERGHGGIAGSSEDRQRGHLQTQVILSQ